MYQKLRTLANGFENIHVLRRVALQKHLKGKEVHLRQLPILDYLLENPDCTQVEIAKELNVTPASIALSTKRMQKAGLLTKKVDEDSLRQNKLAITEEGRAIVRECRAMFRVVNKEMFQDFSKEELDLLDGLLGKIQENLSGSGERLTPMKRAALSNKLNQKN